MFKKFFESSQVLDLPIVTMLGFMIVFGVVLFWVFSKRRASHYDRMSRLPLEEVDE